MPEYRCPKCGRTYSIYEHDQLETQSLRTDDPDDIFGVEQVCECGAGMKSDRWEVKHRQEIQDQEAIVETRAEVLSFGDNIWYRTIVHYDQRMVPVRCYETEEDARTGHAEVLYALNQSRYEFDDNSNIKILEPVPA